MVASWPWQSLTQYCDQWFKGQSVNFHNFITRAKKMTWIVDNVKWQKNFHDRGRERMSFLVFQAVSLQGCPFRTCCCLVIDCWQRQRQGVWRDPCTSTWLAKHCLQILHQWYTILAYYLDNRLLYWNYNCKFLSLLFTFRSQYRRLTVNQREKISQFHYSVATAAHLLDRRYVIQCVGL